MTAGIIINPRSSSAGKRGRRLADEVSKRSGILLESLENFNDLAGILEGFATKGVTTLFISSGDGTVQAIQTLLAENQIFERLPTLAVLPHGTTNMTATTLGCRPGNRAAIADLAESSEALANPALHKTRHTVRVVNPAGRGPLHGMFVGCGSIRGAVEFTQSAMNNNNIRGELAPLATLVTLMGRYLFSGAETGIVKAHALHVEADGQTMAEGPLLLFMASTLEKLVLRCHPYWAPDTSQMKALTIAYPPPNVLRNVLPLMYGLPNRNLPASCQSRSIQTAQVGGTEGYVVDGEFFQAPADEPLRLELGTEFTYLCP
ncbi:MAG: diacylglycerol kinase family protein [Pseudomonadota bacterium]